MQEKKKNKKLKVIYTCLRVSPVSHIRLHGHTYNGRTTTEEEEEEAEEEAAAGTTCCNRSVN
jgi:hypothetical protein